MKNWGQEIIVLKGGISGWLKLLKNQNRTNWILFIRFSIIKKPSGNIFIPKLNLKPADNHFQEIFRMNGFGADIHLYQVKISINIK